MPLRACIRQAHFAISFFNQISINMKKHASFLLILLCVLAASCKKDNTAIPSSAPNVNWTYQGTRLTSTTFTATSQGTGSTFYPDHYTYSLVATSGGNAIQIALSSLSVGTYTDQGNSAEIAIGHDTFDSFVLNITSSSGSTVSGNFTGTYNGQTVTGSFSAITFN